MAVPKFPPPTVGGLERQAYELSAGLIALGYAVTAVSYQHALVQEADALTNGILAVRLRESKFPALRSVKTAFGMARTFHRLRKNIDIVHVHTLSWFSVMAIMLAKLLRKKSVVKLANTGVLGIPGAASTFSGRLRLRILLSASAFVAMNDLSMGELRTAGVPMTKVFFRPNGVPINDLASEPERASSQPTRVAFLGRLSWEKRCSDLLDAWRQVAADRQDIELIIAGTGPEAGVLRDAALRAGLSRVEFVGHVEDVEGFLRSIDILVLPSELEGNSNVVLEGMRASLPIVATDLPGTRLQVGTVGEALLYPVGNAKKLAELVEDLAADRARRRSVGDAMRRRVVEMFDMKRVVADYAAAYDALLNSSEPDLSGIGSCGGSATPRA